MLRDIFLRDPRFFYVQPSPGCCRLGGPAAPVAMAMASRAKGKGLCGQNWEAKFRESFHALSVRAAAGRPPGRETGEKHQTGESAMPGHPRSQRVRGGGDPHQSQTRGLEWPPPARGLVAAGTASDPGPARSPGSEHGCVFQSINRVCRCSALLIDAGSISRLRSSKGLYLNIIKAREGVGTEPGADLLSPSRSSSPFPTPP